MQDECRAAGRTEGVRGEVVSGQKRMYGRRRGEEKRVERMESARAASDSCFGGTAWVMVCPGLAGVQFKSASLRRGR